MLSAPTLKTFQQPDPPAIKLSSGQLTSLAAPAALLYGSSCKKPGAAIPSSGAIAANLFLPNQSGLA